MVIHDRIRDEKIQDNINRETEIVLALSSGKIDKHEYLTGEYIYCLPIKVEQAKFTFSFRKRF